MYSCRSVGGGAKFEKEAYFCASSIFACFGTCVWLGLLWFGFDEKRGVGAKRGEESRGVVWCSVGKSIHE
jgi:hypothetical protein